ITVFKTSVSQLSNLNQFSGKLVNYKRHGVRFGNSKISKGIIVGIGNIYHISPNGGRGSRKRPNIILSTLGDDNIHIVVELLVYPVYLYRDFLAGLYVFVEIGKSKFL